MNLWQQNYDPAGNIWLSSLIASLPILFFFFALIKLKLKGYVAASWTVVIALAVALLFYKMPVDHALASVVYGFFYGLWPIAWIIIAAVFVYKISVKTGQFDIIRSSILSITPDQRLQMLIVGFCFGAFLEGAAGFGAPVAITAALLVGLGFNPLYAAGLCLIVNTAPVAFGAMGIPILVAGQVTGLDSFEIGQMVGRQLPFLTIIVLFWIMAIMDGWRGVKETWPAVMVAGGSFAIAQYLSSNFIGPELPDIISSLVSLVCLTLFLKRWQPVRIFRFGDMGASQVDQTLARTRYTTGQIVRAWSPFLFLTATVTLWSVPPFKALFAPGGALYDWVINVPVPYLDKLVARMPPVVHEATAYAAVYKFDWFSATGTAILFAALLSIVWLKMKPSAAIQTFGSTLKELALPIYSIGMVLAFAFISNYSGLSSTLALALAHTGSAFTFFSPFLGWLGVFLTGSDTSSNALFASLQATAAQQIGVSDVLMVAANTTGGVTGKMISPQSIAIACAAVGLVGKESDLFRFTVKHSLIFTCMVGVITTLQAYVLTYDSVIVMPKRLSDEIASRVRALIEEQNLEAGMKLPAERQLALQLGVSRNSLREALAKLVSEGVLVSRRGGGTFVRWQHETWSEQNIVQPLKMLMANDPDYSFDILEARHAIEASTAWHAAMRATAADKEKIRLCFDATLSEDPDLASQADVRFHLAIAEASHNVVLLQTMRGFFDVLQSSVKQSRQRMYLVPPVFSKLTEQHQAVMDAILDGNAEGARKAMMAHLSFVHTTIKRFDEDQARQARITRLPGDHNEMTRENKS